MLRSTNHLVETNFIATNLCIYLPSHSKNVFFLIEAKNKNVQSWPTDNRQPKYKAALPMTVITTKYSIFYLSQDVFLWKESRPSGLKILRKMSMSIVDVDLKRCVRSR